MYIYIYVYVCVALLVALWQVSVAAGAKAAAQRAGDAPSSKDPFARIENRGTNYYTIATTKELAAIAAAAAAPTLSVAVPEAPSAAGGAASPGFQLLLGTPRPGTPGTPRPGTPGTADLSASDAFAAELAVASFGDVSLSEPSPRGKGPAAGGAKLPVPVGARAEAHLAVELDLDLDLGAETLAAPRAPAVFQSVAKARSAAAAARAAADGAPKKHTLSVSDYKQRMGIM